MHQRSPNRPWTILAVLIVLVTSACSDDDAGSPVTDSRLAADGRGPSPDLTSASDLATRCATSDLDRSCTLGAAYALCGLSGDIGPGGGGGLVEEPRVFCSASRCLWVNDGCPLRGYENLFDEQCSCSGPDCAAALPTAWRFFSQYGSKPWNAVRKPLLPVTVDSNAGGQFVAPSCSGCPSCVGTSDNPCNASKVTSREVDATTKVVRVEPTSFLHGWRLEIEVDLGPHAKHARLCRMALSDALSCSAKEPACATSGKVTVTSGSATGPLHGTYDVSFDDGLRIVGEL